MYSNYKEKIGAMANNDFTQLYTGKSNGVIPVYKYRSKKTGLTVVIAQVEGPLVNGYFCLATEAQDDDGLPHTLEHIIFMGSEKYPYKGVLDLLANRCLASGTNAWTDTDHTCYTMTTAGSEGFLNLLPIYLDHVLYPTMTESAYVTEVHHINGEGEDAGVVYCEMQARENTGESLCHLNMLRSMYPGNCGYKSETGGIMKNLRESTSHEKVGNYHKEFYRPENLCLIITGQVEPEQVFKVLKPFEDKILSKGSLPPYEKPWQSIVPELPETVEKVIKYSSDDEENGMVYVAWRGPLAKDQYSVTSLYVMLEYLTVTAVAPLQRDFVEIEDPYCSRVRYSLIENSETCFYIGFKNVPKGKLSNIKERLFEVMKKLGNEEEKINMQRMKDVIHRRILESQSSLEDQPHDTMAFVMIGDFLYGNGKEDLDVRLNQISSFKKLKEEPKDYWVKLINKYIVDAKSVTMVGEPSTQLMKDMGEEEKARIAKQRETLGESGLKEKTVVLDKATEENEIEPPEEMLTSVAVPDVGCIKFHKINPSDNYDESTTNANEKFPLSDIPVAFQLDDIQTNFATMSVLMDTACVPSDLKMYLPLLLEVLTESPIMREGTLVSHEDIVTELAADTLENDAGLGLGGGNFSPGAFSQVACLNLKVEMEKYKKGVQWIRELLYQVQFTVDRLKIMATKMTNDVSQLKRNGRYVVQTLFKGIVFNKESYHYSTSMLRQHKFLSSLVEKLGKPETAQEIIATMNKIRDLLTQPKNLRVHLSVHAAAAASDGSPQAPWIEEMLPADMKKEGERPKVKSDKDFVLPITEGQGQGVIAGVGSVESSYLIQVTSCPVDHIHPDLAAIKVFIQYLTQLEGPMWRQIRGLGLSYHYSMFVRPDTGMLVFNLFRSTHVADAYKCGKEIVDGYLNGKTPYSEVELETCKSSLIFEVIEKEQTPSDASQESLLSYFRGTPKDYNRTLINNIPKVTLEDLSRIGKTYIAPLFDPSRSKVAICCHPTKVEEVVSDFKKFGRELTMVDSLETSFLAEL